MLDEKCSPASPLAETMPGTARFRRAREPAPPTKARRDPGSAIPFHLLHRLQRRVRSAPQSLKFAMAQGADVGFVFRSLESRLERTHANARVRQSSPKP